MQIETFHMERYQSEWENRVQHNLSESGVNPMLVEELLAPAEFDDILKQSLLYIHTNGSPGLREAIARLYPGASADNVIVVNGSAEANFISAWRLVEPGDEVVMILPNYMQLTYVIESFGARVRPVWLRETGGAWRVDLESLARTVNDRTRLIVVCNPNNPTGAVLNQAERSAIIAAASKQGSWILADEVYRGAERLGAETESFWGQYDRLICTCGLSKAYGLPGLRIGWVVTSEGMYREMWARKDYLTLSPGTLSDVLARKALARRGRIRERTLAILQNNYAALENWLGERRDYFAVIPPHAGAIAYVRYLFPYSSMELALRLRDEFSVLIVPGAQFNMESYIRIGTGNTPEDLSGGLERIDQFLKTL